MEEIKVKKINKLLIVIIVILLLFVVSLGYYTYFIRNKKTSNIKDNKVEENNNIKEEVKEEVINGQLSQEEIEKVLYNFPYEKLLHIEDKNLNNLTNEDLLYIGAYGLTAKTSYDGLDCYEDKDETLKCIMGKLGLSSDEIKNANAKLWKLLYSSDSIYKIVSKNELIKEITVKTGKTFNFDDSFVEDISVSCGWVYIIYDKSIDKLFIRTDVNCGSYPNVIKITGGYKAGEDYIITMTKGLFELTNNFDVNYYKLHSESKPYVIIKDNVPENSKKEDLEAVVLQYKDKLDNYTLKFKKIGENYQFVSIDYIK